MHPHTIALLGGTGRSGPGLALRLALAGVPVIIGSRQAERGAAAAAAVAARVAEAGGGAEVTGTDNAAACDRSTTLVVTVPYEGQATLLQELCGRIRDGSVVVSTAIPLQWDAERRPWHVDVAEGSAAQQVAALLPRARVVGALHSLSSSVLADPTRRIDSDVIVTGDDAEAKEEVMRLAELLPGVHAVDGGPLRYARYSEQLTVLLLSVNKRYRRHAGVIVTDLPRSSSGSSDSGQV